MVEHGFVKVIWKREYPVKSDADVAKEVDAHQDAGKLSEEAFPLLSMCKKKTRRGKKRKGR